MGPKKSKKGTHLFSPGAVSAPGENKCVPFLLFLGRLWLALYLPRFPLEVLGAERVATRPLAVISGSGAGTVIVAAGAGAESARCASVHVGERCLRFGSESNTRIP